MHKMKKLLLQRVKKHDTIMGKKTEKTKTRTTQVEKRFVRELENGEILVNTCYLLSPCCYKTETK